MKPWRPDLKWGAVEQENGILLVIEADQDWQGKLYFDQPRHKSYLNLPIDYPRINQFPEWFVVDTEKSYTIEYVDAGATQSYQGNELIEGIDLELEKGERLVMKVLPGNN